ncbi:MAG: dipeptidyl-peptidase 3 family protein [bacterium]
MRVLGILLMASLVIAPDIHERAAKWKPVKMPYDASRLSQRERQMIDALVEASQHLGRAYWQQTDPKALEIWRSLANATDPREVAARRLLFIMGSRWDLLDDHKPFIGTETAPPGLGYYDAGITREEIEAWVKAHPESREAIYSGYTVVRRKNGALVAIPYHEEYREFVEPASKALLRAAELSDDPQFARFLRLRAAALLTDDYYESDLAWMDLKDPKFDVIMGPYETYGDGLLGIKAAYEAAILIRDEEESKKLATFAAYVPELQEALPLAPEDRPSKHGLATPMEVMYSPFRSGDARHGYQAVATNLPNDPRIHVKKGTKKIFYKNFMDARVNEVILPIGKRLMQPDAAARVTGEGYLTAVLLHEISHGLGPAYARIGGKQVEIREAMGPLYSALEEAKADATGMFGLEWLVRKGALPKERLPEYYNSYVAGIFRTLRFGTAEAHGQAELMEFNYLTEQKAIVRDAAGRYGIDMAKMPEAFARLTQELLEIEATGDRARGEKLFARYTSIPADLEKALESIKDIPVDVDPVFDFPSGIN